MEQDDVEDDEFEETEDSVGDDTRDGALVFGGGVALGAALLAIVWLGVSVIGGHSDPSPRHATTQVGSPVLGAAAASPDPSRQDRCEQALRTLSAPLRAAQPAMDQWEVHIGAMNKLVVGAITLQQATAFWDQTRVGAQHRIADFRSSMRAMRRSGVDCPTRGMLPRAAAPSLRACVDRVDADMRALDAARTAIATWDMHVGDMERLRAGTLSPTKASQMWLTMWHRGQEQVTAYRTAVRDARKAGSCDAGSRAEPSAGASSDPTSAPSMDMSGMG